MFSSLLWVYPSKTKDIHVVLLLLLNNSPWLIEAITLRQNRFNRVQFFCAYDVYERAGDLPPPRLSVFNDCRMTRFRSSIAFAKLCKSLDAKVFPRRCAEAAGVLFDTLSRFANAARTEYNQQPAFSEKSRSAIFNILRRWAMNRPGGLIVSRAVLPFIRSLDTLSNSGVKKCSSF